MSKNNTVLFLNALLSTDPNTSTTLGYPQQEPNATTFDYPLDELTISNTSTMDYDYAPCPVFPVGRYEFLFYVVLIAPLCIIGLCTHAISIMAFLYSDLNSYRINRPLVALCISDILVLVTSLLAFTMPVLANRLDILTSVMSDITSWTYPLINVSHTLHVWLTVALSMFRFFGICFPLHARASFTTVTLHRIVICTVVFSMLFNGCRFMELTAKTCWSTQKQRYVRQLFPTPLYESMTYNTLKLIAYTVVMFVLPFVILTVLNTCAIVTMWRAHEYRIRVLKTPAVRQRVRSFRLKSKKKINVMRRRANSCDAPQLRLLGKVESVPKFLGQIVPTPNLLTVQQANRHTSTSSTTSNASPTTSRDGSSTDRPELPAAFEIPEGHLMPMPNDIKDKSTMITDVGSISSHNEIQPAAKGTRPSLVRLKNWKETEENAGLVTADLSESDRPTPMVRSVASNPTIFVHRATVVRRATNLKSSLKKGGPMDGRRKMVANKSVTMDPNNVKNKAVKGLAKSSAKKNKENAERKNSASKVSIERDSTSRRLSKYTLVKLQAMTEKWKRLSRGQRTMSRPRAVGRMEDFQRFYKSWQATTAERNLTNTMIANVVLFLICHTIPMVMNFVDIFLVKGAERLSPFLMETFTVLTLLGNLTVEKGNRSATSTKNFEATKNRFGNHD